MYPGFVSWFHGSHLFLMISEEYFTTPWFYSKYGTNYEPGECRGTEGSMLDQLKIVRHRFAVVKYTFFISKSIADLSLGLQRHELAIL